LTIFAEYAPTYWAAGLPVIPLRQRNKMPDINQWSRYGREMPTQLEQQHWLASYPKGNIGLPLGPASGICVIDIDTEDAALDAAIREICGPTPWVRVGKKGAALAYRFEGQRNFKLRGADGGMICEFLGLGNQVVLPPSIHPDTGQPYTASANLWDVLDKLPYLGEDIEDKLRGLLGAKGFEIGAGGRSGPVDIVPAGERDVQMIRYAGYLARVVLGIDRSATFGLMDAMAHMHTWVVNFTAKVSGDAMDPEKGVAKLLEFLLKDLEKGRTMPEGWDAGMPDEVRAHPTIQKLIEANAEQRWTPDRAIAWFDNRVIEKPTNRDWATTAVDMLINMMAGDSQLSPTEEIVVFNHIVKRSNLDLGLTVRELRAALNRARSASTHREQASHRSIAASVRDQLQLYGEVRFDHDQFWQWNGSCFGKLQEDALYMHVADSVRDEALVRRHSDYKAIVEVLERMCKGDLVQVSEPGINFANGFVKADLSVVEHDPRYGATFTLPFVYDPENATRCRKWMDFLVSVWGHEPDFEKRVLALQEMFAVTLFKMAPRYQRAFLLYGRAGTGKTQILNVLRALLPPDAVAELGPQLWGERFSLTDLIGKAANICGELPENGMITGHIFKEVVEGLPQRTEFKGRDGFSFVPACAHWFASNYLPVSRDSSRGFNRRWLVLDFNKPVRDEDKVENLAEILIAEEREAIVAWALEGLSRVAEAREYTLPGCHHDRQAQMRRISNSVEAFLQDSAQVGRGDGELHCRELYDLYSSHQRHTVRGAPVSFERFLQMLEDVDLDVERRRDVLGAVEHIVRGVMRTPQVARAA
jgi:putative DNA primase/helicase